MAHKPKPFFKKSHGAWYVEIDKRQIRLAESEDVADQIYHEIMAARKKAARFITPGVELPYSMGRLKLEFFASALLGSAEQTRVFYASKLNPFVAHLGESFLVTELKPFHVEDWIAKHPKWKKGTARTVWKAIHRMMRWGGRSGRIPHSSICDYEKPGATRRNRVVSPEEFQTQILPFIRSEQFRDLVTVAWEVGARPQELLKAEVRHYEPKQKRIVFPEDEAKGDTYPRIIYLTEEAAVIVERLIATVQTGRIFRNQSGKPWKSFAVNCEWVRLRHRVGFSAMKQKGIEPTEAEISQKMRLLSRIKKESGREREKTDAELREEAKLKCRQKLAAQHAPKFCMYHFRHSWLDRMLKKGVDVLTCAILLGHKDPTMISRTYQHLSQSPDYLRAALNKAG